MLNHAVRRFLILLVGTSVGGWLSAHLQFGISGYWGLGADELDLIGFVTAVALVALLVFLLPLSLLIERYTPPHLSNYAVAVASPLTGIALGLAFYVILLHRPFSLVVERDWPDVLAFALVGLGYAIAHRFQKSI